MNRLLCAACLLTAVVFSGTAGADDYAKCFLTPADQVGFKDDLIGPAACEAACKGTDGCTAWTYRPHSFEPKTMPGQCKLISTIFKEEESTKVFCGKL